MFYHLLKSLIDLISNDNHHVVGYVKMIMFLPIPMENLDLFFSYLYIMTMHKINNKLGGQIRKIEKYQKKKNIYMYSHAFGFLPITYGEMKKAAKSLYVP